MLTAMSDLTFAQAERRNFLVPAIIAIVVLAVIALVVAHFYNPVPPLAADITLTKVAYLPEHIVFHEDSIVVGHKDPFEDDLYAVANVRIVNRLKVPLLLNDITILLTAPDGTQTTASAANKKDLPNLYVTFPALKPVVSEPVLRGTKLQPGEQAEGMVLFTFPITQAVWDQRKSAVISFDFINQTPVEVTIPNPKDQGTGNSK
jgi:hypothetical protein